MHSVCCWNRSRQFHEKLASWRVNFYMVSIFFVTGSGTGWGSRQTAGGGHLSTATMRQVRGVDWPHYPLTFPDKRHFFAPTKCARHFKRVCFDTIPCENIKVASYHSLHHPVVLAGCECQLPLVEIFSLQILSEMKTLCANDKITHVRSALSFVPMERQSKSNKWEMFRFTSRIAAPCPSTLSFFFASSQTAAIDPDTLAKRWGNDDRQRLHTGPEARTTPAW